MNDKSSKKEEKPSLPSNDTSTSKNVKLESQDEEIKVSDGPDQNVSDASDQKGTSVSRLNSEKTNYKPKYDKKKSDNIHAAELDTLRKQLFHNKLECSILKNMKHTIDSLKQYRENPDNNLKDQTASRILDLEKINKDLTNDFNLHIFSIGDDLFDLQNENSNYPDPKICHKYPDCPSCTSCWFVHQRKSEIKK
jgi:hypothetical protein